MLFNENAITNQIQHYKSMVSNFFENMKTSRSSRAREEKNLDKSIQESFPASDAPAHRSKSTEDRKFKN